MGQKINPFIFRAILNRNWSSAWYSESKFFPQNLLEDYKIRNYIFNYFKKKNLINVLIQKSLKLINIFIIVNNKTSFLKYVNILDLKKKIIFLIKKNIFIDFINLNNPNVNLCYIFHKLKEKISQRKSYKVLIKNIFYNFFNSGGIGIKILIKGRINGSAMSKRQVYKQGKLPLQKISADIKYYFNYIRTIHGVIGIKLWSYMGNLIY